MYRKFIVAHPVYLDGIRVKFVYESHQVKVEVTGAKRVENPYSRSAKVLSAITPVLRNIEPLNLHVSWRIFVYG